MNAVPSTDRRSDKLLHLLCLMVSIRWSEIAGSSEVRTWRSLADNYVRVQGVMLLAIVERVLDKLVIPVAEVLAIVERVLAILVPPIVKNIRVHLRVTLRHGSALLLYGRHQGHLIHSLVHPMLTTTRRPIHTHCNFHVHYSNQLAVESHVNSDHSNDHALAVVSANHSHAFVPLVDNAHRSVSSALEFLYELLIGRLLGARTARVESVNASPQQPAGVEFSAMSAAFRRRRSAWRADPESCAENAEHNGITSSERTSS